MTGGALDRQAAAVQRRFSLALSRLQVADSEVAAEDELTFALDQLYRLHELMRSRLPGKDVLHALLQQDHLRPARALNWVRTQDVHDLVQLSRFTGVYEAVYSTEYPTPTTLVWGPRPAALADAYDRHEDYDSRLAGQAVTDPLANAFTHFLAALPARR